MGQPGSPSFLLLPLGTWPCYPWPRPSLSCGSLLPRSKNKLKVKKKKMATPPVFLPGESHGQGSLTVHGVSQSQKQLSD